MYPFASNLLKTYNLTLSTTAQQLENQPCVGVMLQASPNNAFLVRFGDASTQAHWLTAGQAVYYPVANANLVTVKAGSGSAEIAVSILV